MEPKSFSEMHVFLKNSFEAIKRDMTKLKEDISVLKHSQIISENELKKDIVSIKETGATVDKLNVLKIKLNEVSEDIKKLNELKKEISEVEKTALSKKEFEAYSADNKKQYMQFIKDTNSRVDVLKNEVKLAKQKEETLLDKPQFNTFVAQLNKELNYLREKIEKTYNIKDEITKRELDRRAGELADKIEKLEKFVKDEQSRLSTVSKITGKNEEDLEKISKSVQTNMEAVKHRLDQKASESQIKALVNDVNKEFEKLKSEVNKIKSVNDEIADVRKSLSELKKTVALDEEIDVLQDEINVLKDRMLTERDISKIVKGTNDLKHIKETKVEKAKESARFVTKNSVAPHLNKGQKNYRKTLFFGNLFIVLSFISLIGALGAFVFNNAELMDNLSIAAIIWFVIGIILRIFVILRRDQ